MGCRKCIFPRNCLNRNSKGCAIKGERDFRAASFLCGENCGLFKCGWESDCLAKNEEGSDESKNV